MQQTLKKGYNILQIKTHNQLSTKVNDDLTNAESDLKKRIQTGNEEVRAHANKLHEELSRRQNGFEIDTDKKFSDVNNDIFSAKEGFKNGLEKEQREREEGVKGVKFFK